MRWDMVAQILRKRQTNIQNDATTRAEEDQYVDDILGEITGERMRNPYAESQPDKPREDDTPKPPVESPPTTQYPSAPNGKLKHVTVPSPRTVETNQVHPTEKKIVSSDDFDIQKKSHRSSKHKHPKQQQQPQQPPPSPSPSPSIQIKQEILETFGTQVIAQQENLGDVDTVPKKPHKRPNKPKK
jgi:hypothetical protein